MIGGIVLAAAVFTTTWSFSPFVSYSSHHLFKIMPTRSAAGHPPPISWNMISSGFSFDDGNQILVSVQKPLGLVLEQEDDGPIVVSEVDPDGSAGSAGVQVGDVLLAVQNASVETADLDSVLNFMEQGPRVINLRLLQA